MKDKKISKRLCVAILSIICCVLAITTIGTTTIVKASGNAPINNLAGYESHSHVVSQTLMGSPTNYTESVYKNTGIKIYASSNSGSVTTGTSVTLDSTSLYVDFTGANSMYTPSTVYENICYTTHYRFEIVSNYGYTAWYIDYSVDISSDTPYERVFNVYGTKTTKYDTDGADTMNFQPTELGNKLINLYNGNFTWKLTREYMWIRYDISNKIYGIYESTSTLTGTILVDNITPTLSVKGYSDSSTITNGSYVKQRVTVTASDNNFNRLYYKQPGNSYYNSTTSTTYTSTAINGWWYFYAVDKVGNKTSEFSIYYDGTAPTGYVTSNGSSVASGSYVSNSFSYTACDSGSGIKQIYYKTPVNGTYQVYSSGTIIPSNSGDGWYYFYAVDKAGNQSSIAKVYLETQAPLLEIYRNGEVAYSTSINSSGTYDSGVYLNKNDFLKIKYDSSSGTVNCNYSLDSNISIDDSFDEFQYTITIKTPTGITANYNFYIIDEKPYIIIDGTKYQNSDVIYKNQDSFISIFDDSDIKDSLDTGLTITSDGNQVVDKKIKYSEASGLTLTTENNTETIYYLTLNDRAGNISIFTIIIDKSPVKATWKLNDGEVENYGYTNKEVYLDYSEENVTAVYSKDGSEYKTYSQGTKFNEDGKYVVVLSDLAGNKSTYVINIDTIAPTGKLYSNYEEIENDSITNGKIYFTWDGDNTATINGNPYTKNSVISEDGKFEFILTDKAGNYRVYQIEIDTVKPTYNQDKLNSNTDYKVGKWYIVNFDKKEVSFATYESALQYAISKEYEKYVTTLTLNDVNDFTQYHLVASRNNPKDDIKVGTYYRYKSQANKDNELYYFDESLLKEVITYYAKSYVSDIIYFNIDNNNYGEASSNMFDNKWTSNDGVIAPIGNNYIFEKEDSNSIFAKLVGTDNKIEIKYGIVLKDQLKETGLYEITETDQAGNISSYYIFIDYEAPTIKVNAEVFGEGESKEINITSKSVSDISTYYYKSFELSEIIDNDTWAIVEVIKDNKSSFYSKEDNLPTLCEGGKYKIVVYDRLNNSYEFTVYIVGNEASITFNPNKDLTEFTIDISLEQEFDTIVSLEIYKDGNKLEDVSTDTLKYTFTKDGTYTVVLRDNFGRIIERTYKFDKSLPNGTLSVNDNDKTKDEVKFSFDNEKYYTEVYLNDYLVETNNSGNLNFKNDGNYTIKLINLTDEENYNIYSFTIDNKAPDIILDGVEKGKTTNKDVSVTWNDLDVLNATYSLNGSEEVTFENGLLFKEEGIYIIKVSDDLGNTREVMFTIDKSLDYEVYVGGSLSTGLDTTNDEVLIISNEELIINVTKNNESYNYSFGDTLSEEGIYIINISDLYGNSTTISITIDKSVDAYISCGNGTISNDEVYITAGEKVSAIVTKDDKPFEYVIGQPITEEGKYKVVIYDTYGNQKTFTFEIVKGTKTVIDYTLGDDVEIIEVKLNGVVIEHNSNHLNFTTDGTYEITVLVDGETHTFKLSLDTTAPEIIIDGIDDGETKDTTVVIKEMNEEGTIKVYKDGELIEYTLGNEIKDYGTYVIEVSDLLGNTRTYSFTLEYQMNGWAIALIGIGILIISGIVVLICLKKKRVFKD